MKKLKKLNLLLAIVSTISVLSFSNAAESNTSSEYSLEKVVILSRHGLRAPLSTPGSALSKVTPFAWSPWDVEASYLTKKGATLELHFGQYISDWLNQNGIKTAALKNEEALIYTNSLQRTITTGQALVTGIFPGSNIAPIHKMEIGKMDPVFNPVVRESDEAALQKYSSKMELDKINSELQESYQLVSNVIDYKNSELCLKENKCDFLADTGKITLTKDKEPGTTGALRVGTQIVDALLLQYYEGFPDNKIANGNVKTEQAWKLLNKIKNKYGDLLFGSKPLSSHLAKPLLEYMNNELTNDQRKVTVLVGHDSNAVSVLSALNTKDYVLENQDESTPIGSKIFFEIWKNNKTNEKKIKIEYVYQTKEQIKNNAVLTLQNKPMHKTLELTDCPIDPNGYCAFDKFESIIQNVIKNY